MYYALRGRLAVSHPDVDSACWGGIPLEKSDALYRAFCQGSLPFAALGQAFLVSEAHAGKLLAYAIREQQSQSDGKAFLPHAQRYLEELCTLVSGPAASATAEVRRP